jgi:alpha-L-fucosidase
MAELTIPLGLCQSIGGVRIEEAIRYGQRVSEFAVDISHWGAWYEVARGTTIGAQRILRLASAEGEALRIRILRAQAPAILARVLVYAS